MNHEGAPGGQYTRDISRKETNGSRRCSTTMLHVTRSKLASGKGSESRDAQTRRHILRCLRKWGDQDQRRRRSGPNSPAGSRVGRCIYPATASRSRQSRHRMGRARCSMTVRPRYPGSGGPEAPFDAASDGQPCDPATRPHREFGIVSSVYFAFSAGLNLRG